MHDNGYYLAFLQFPFDEPCNPAISALEFKLVPDKSVAARCESSTPSFGPFVGLLCYTDALRDHTAQADAGYESLH